MVFLSPIKIGLIRFNSTAFFAESIAESWLAHTIPAATSGVFLANDIKDISSFANENKIQITTKEEIFFRSDIISVHTPLDEKTTNLINKSVFKKMKEDAILINTARGGIVNEDDLIHALRKKTIAGAATDVYTIEPPKNMDLLSIPNLITTPHIAGNSKEAVISMGMAAIESLNKFKMELWKF